MYYYKRMNNDGTLHTLLRYDKARKDNGNPFVLQITEDEYNALSAEMDAVSQPEEPDPDEISAEEAMNIILGVSE